MIAGCDIDRLDIDAITSELPGTDYEHGKMGIYVFSGSRKTIEVQYANDEAGTGMIMLDIKDGSIESDALIVLEYFTAFSRNRA